MEQDVSDTAAPPPPPPPGQGADTSATQATEPAPAQPWWTRWWGIAIIAFAALLLIAVLAGNQNEADGDLAADEVAPPRPSTMTPTTHQSPTWC